MIEQEINKDIVDICQKKLLKTKQDLLNLREAQSDRVISEGQSGDEADQSARLMEEKSFLDRLKRINTKLVDVEMALSRIEQGFYGICSETGEPIEPNRLIVIPWTSLSIEGAEIRENLKSKYVSSR